MPRHPSMSVQCFVKRSFTPPFTGEDAPVLVRISKVLPEVNENHPRMMHSHEKITEVVLICEGTGGYLIGKTRYAVGPGDLLVYNAGVIHDEMSGPDSPVGYYCVGIGGLHRPGLPEYTLISEEKGCCFPTGEAFGDLLSLMEMIYQCLTRDVPQAEAFCDCLARALLIRTLAIVEGAETPPPVEPDLLADRIKGYIDEHYQEPLSLQSIGETLHVSPYYLSHVFKKRWDYAPMQYLTRRRIGEAQTLLLETSLPVGRIAEMVGYETQNYFNQQFTRFTGMPPRRYRQNFLHDGTGEDVSE